MVLKQSIQHYRQSMLDQYLSGKSITTLTLQLSRFMDQTVCALWRKTALSDSTFCLIALGSYGRCELQPYSDLDLLILYQAPPTEKEKQRINQFIQALWDARLSVGHQLSDIDSCAKLAATDLSVISNLMSMRYLTGPRISFDALRFQTHPSQVWPATAFFKAKWQEQQRRYKKFNVSAYHLEPNVKQGPGGLRDIQMILWVAQRIFGVDTFKESFSCGLLTKSEYQTLSECQHFLWKVRFALHLSAGRAEDRLLFDYQKKVASVLGYQDNEQGIAIEQFMKNYFSVLKTLREYNDMLLQLFREQLFHPIPPTHQTLSGDFQVINRYIEATNLETFSRTPHTLLSIFLAMVKHPEIKGVRANTIRLIRESKQLIDDNFRNDTNNTQCFMQILKIAPDVYKILACMNRYGILGAYIPAFSDIIGQMQYDLFHIYTVDQHSLLVIRQLVSFKSHNVHFPLCYEILQKIDKVELLILSALFHDIGKGRGGCHSTIGAAIALEFCARHSIAKDDATLVAWLVQHHLLMSKTAQTKDIHEPQTILEFCRQVGSIRQLNYLYLLTTADICATNPNLWNSWKDTLLKILYQKTSDMINLKEVPDEDSQVSLKKHQALALLKPNDSKRAELLWQQFKSSYFLGESPAMIVRHTESILHTSVTPMVNIYPHHHHGGTQVLIYQPHNKQRFEITTSLFNNLQLTIVEARIQTTLNHFDLDSYIILDRDNKMLSANRALENLRQNIINHLTPPVIMPELVQTLISRQLRHFKVAPQSQFQQQPAKNRTQLSLVATDMPGLLAKIAKIFARLNIDLHSAKIATAGERANDLFIISANGRPLTVDEQATLSQKIKSTIQ